MTDEAPEQDRPNRYGPVSLSSTDKDDGARLYIEKEALEESGLDADGAAILQPYKNGIHVIAAKQAVPGDSQSSMEVER
jgi:hypothetical protein